MAGLLPDVDPDGLLEYSVVYTDRALNHMSQNFQEVMHDLSAALKRVYRAHSTVIVPGSGTFGMEAVARQFATDRRCLVIRNGWFSYRWTQILDRGKIPSDLYVRKARRVDDDDPTSPFAPPDIDEVIEAIHDQQPDLVFAPHVETASGMILPDEYMRRIAEAIHEENGLFVLDCIASGTAWVDMLDIGVDVLISAPQKGWSASPCCGLVMLSRLAREIIDETTSSSFACDLRKWLSIMETYEAGGHAYHATLPTDGLRQLRDVIAETEAYGLDKVRDEQFELGRRVREMLAEHGFQSVAAPGYEAPGVVVSYTDDAEIAAKFAKAGVQVAAGVPLMCDEGEDFQSFRIGLFGLDKLHNIERSVEQLERALKEVEQQTGD
ncbi:aminotransferase class V-fold PLP-dependent enzyme [Halomonas elongata]|uniref:Aminotransferase class V-fold PLP-dependent enzyme n=1 Tax=Halomonas elongata (strain ATCC 33173 / DSM 2581 / NBRC 15536 / NCIMB 2198 / 1H9) TaxID=768066 RepID=E1V578_HALED|nr:aminotransferase class V-fold PLP-dependent enzyme [Halomonas elongata]MBW5799884.1 aminotransferase class V-fold PLP-dependent enzyme [Halomonas elongata]RAW08019.1 alanine--glyoxylate aminotransferase family protein [Halomonas elongata]WBF16773.1 aminotransferase class V-fold PLP-dependent enzyme [Halomonas elongata]WPU45604.1 aminotransferase class V-fold PLP-dependent enzyme [Halomonas elongata DSM 2581]WVI70450.1 aminotransferase class V-fold PLP-dependent enzyme [Halomonas elongata]